MSDQYIKNILKVMQLPCNHFYKYPYRCEIYEYIERVHQNGDRLTIADIDGEVSICEKIIRYVCKDHYNCINERYSDCVFEILSYWMPDKQIINLLHEKIKYRDTFRNLIMNIYSNPDKNSIILDNTCIFSYFESFRDSYIDEDSFITCMNYYLELSDIKNIFENDFPDAFFGIRSKQVYEILVKYMCSKYDISVLEKACSYIEYMCPVIEYMLQYYEITSTCFKNACECNYDNIDKDQLDPMNYILNKSRVKFTHEHFNAIFVNYSKKKLDILLKNGYELDESDILYSIRYKIEIEDISRYNIILDKKILEECWKYDFYPTSYKFLGVNQKMIKLEKLCTYNRSCYIENYIKKHKLIPDKKCMINACKIPNNYTCIKILLDHKGVLDYECLETCIIANNNHTLTFVLETYNKNKDQIIEKKEEEEIFEEKEGEEIFEEKQEIIYIELKDKRSKIKNMKKLYKTPIKYKKLVKNTSLGDLSSYIQVRKDYIEYLKNNNMIVDLNSCTYINLPENIRKKLKIDIDKKYIRIEDLDKLIAYYY